MEPSDPKEKVDVAGGWVGSDQCSLIALDGVRYPGNARRFSVGLDSIRSYLPFELFVTARKRCPHPRIVRSQPSCASVIVQSVERFS